jgi:hypothetical protein
MKKLIIAALLAGSFGGAATAVSAHTINVREAPPAPRHEVVPAARHGYVWSPGHYEYRGHRYVWIRGTWLRERHGYSYRAPTWEERDGRWVMTRGGWDRGRRDRDGDGVPNRFDEHPNNPNRQ